MCLKFSDLCEKEVVNLCDGQKIGYVCDLSFDECARVMAIYVAPIGKFFSCKRKKPICIPWDRIQRLGEDVILVNWQTPEND